MSQGKGQTAAKVQKDIPFPRLAEIYLFFLSFLSKMACFWGKRML